VRVASSLDEETPYDLLIVTLLARQADRCCRLCSAAPPAASSSCSTPSSRNDCKRHRRPAMRLWHAVRAGDPGWRRPAQGRDRRRRPEDHHEPPTLGDVFNRGWIALGSRGANASLASLPRSPLRGVRERVGRRASGAEAAHRGARPSSWPAVSTPASRSSGRSDTRSIRERRGASTAAPCG